VEKAFPLQIVVIVDAEARIDEDVTQVKIYPTTTDGNNSHHAAQGSQVDALFFYITAFIFSSITVASPTPC